MDQTQSPPTAPNRIFVSYRRQEAEWPAGWLFDRLAEHFRGAEVFKDIDSIEPGDDFVQVITSAVESCDVLLALIGDKWLTMTDDQGRRRIDNPDDFVRIEIEAALSRNVRVIPILVYGARMPRAQDVPAGLAGLVRRQALELSVSRFDDDVTRLLKVLDKTLAEARTRPIIMTSPQHAQTPAPPTPETQTPPEQTQTPPEQTQTPPQQHMPPQQTTPRQESPPQEAPVTRTPPARVTDGPLPGHATDLSERAAPPGDGDRGTAAGWRDPRRLAIVSVVIVAIVLGGLGVWSLFRSNTDVGNTQSTSNVTSSGASPSTGGGQSPTPSPTVNRPLLVWQDVGSPATKLGGPAAAAYKDQIWVVGGMEKTVRIYDPRTAQWRNGPPLPAGLSYGALASDGQRLYYMGGINGDVWGVPTVYVLDSPEGQWRKGPSLPEARFSGAAAWDGQRIVFAGGTQGRSPRRAASEVWALTSGRWEVIGNLPHPREKLAAATDGKGTVWFVGGADVSARTVSGEVDEVRGSTVGQSDSLQTPVQGLAAVWSSASGVCAIGGSTTLPNDYASPTATVTCLRSSGWPVFPQATGLATSTTLDNTAYVIAGTRMFALRFGS
jgi:TIR domain/Kelch motif